VQVGAGKVDLAPFEIDGLGNAETVPRHDQDERCIALAPAAFTRGTAQWLRRPAQATDPLPSREGSRASCGSILRDS
jgi:hypothetical protein